MGLALKPEQRIKWLNKALKQVSEGKVKANDIYDLISTAKFYEPLPTKVGRKMGYTVNEQIHLFSAKQQRFLQTGASIITQFTKKEEAKQEDDDDESEGETVGDVVKASTI